MHVHTHALYYRLNVLKSARVPTIALASLVRVARSGRFRRRGIFIVRKSARIASRALALQKCKADSDASTITSRRRSRTTITSTFFVRKLARITSRALASLVRVAHWSAAAAAAETAVRRFRPVRKFAILSSRALASFVRVALRFILAKPRFLCSFARFTSRRFVFPPFRGVKLLFAGRKHKRLRAVSAGERLVFERVHDFASDELLVRFLVHFEAVVVVVVVVVVFLFFFLGLFFGRCIILFVVSKWVPGQGTNALLLASPFRWRRRVEDDDESKRDAKRGVERTNERTNSRKKKELHNDDIDDDDE